MTSWDDFTDNLATDLAPFIILFGEQVTKQYLSESVHWLDSVIFAMAPLGILVAMVSVIRVRGNASLRAFIGRAQESRGVIEAELMSSTSKDVCELWNGDGVARVLGRPRLLEIVYDPSSKGDVSSFYDTHAEFGEIGDVRKPRCGIYTFKEFVQSPSNKAWKQWKKLENPTAVEVGSKDHATEIAPNLSLNLGIERRPVEVLISAATGTAILQFGLALYAIIATHYLGLLKNGQPVPSYSVPFAVTGMVMVSFGLFMCATMVEQSTTEELWRRSPTTTPSRMYWLQPGGQTVGDQVFGPFADTAQPTTYMTSSRDRSRQNSPVLVYLVCINTTVGFVLQFVGLRSMHSSVALAQLGATLLASLVRASLRMKRSRNNLLEDKAQFILGHELDWLAMELDSSHNFSIIPSRHVRPILHHAASGQGVTDGAQENSDTDYTVGLLFNAGIGPGPILDVEARVLSCLQVGLLELGNQSILRVPNTATRTARHRARLARMTPKWHLPSRIQARTLKAALESTLAVLFSGKTVLTNHWHDTCTILCPIRVSTGSRTACTVSSVHPIHVAFRRSFDNEKEQWSQWTVDESDLESILSLWILYLIAAPVNMIEHRGSVAGCYRIFGENTEDTRTDYQIWVFRHTDLQAESVDININQLGQISSRADGTTVRYFGLQNIPPPMPGSPARDILAIRSSSTLYSLCAQEIFTCIFGALISLVIDIGGTTIRQSGWHHQEAHATAIPQNASDRFRLRNSILHDIVLALMDSGLCSIEEAYVCIIPPLRHRGKLPHATAAHDDARKAAQAAKRNSQWEEAAKILWWIYRTSEKSDFSAIARAISDIGELYRVALRHKPSSSQTYEFGYQGILKMLSWNRNDPTFVQLSSEYGWIALRIAESSNDSYAIASLTAAGATFNVVPEYTPQTTFLDATRNLCLPAARLLVDDSRSDIRKRDAHGRNALSYASELGSLPLVDLILENGGFDAPDNEGRTALSYAAAAESALVVERLLSRDIKDVDRADNKGLTALAWAAMAGRLEIVKCLLNIPGVNIDIRDHLLQSPLHKAATLGHYDLVEFLLQKGADLRARDAGGFSALHEAAYRGEARIVRLFCDRGSPIEDRNIDGETALLRSVWVGDIKTVRTLLEKGASVESRSNDGSTAIHVACLRGFEDSTALLIEYGSQLGDRDNSGDTPLHRATFGGHIALMHLLLSQGVELDPRNGSGDTPLHLAVWNGRIEALRLLLDHGAAPQARNNQGETPLYRAAAASEASLVGMLLTRADDIHNGIIEAPEYGTPFSFCRDRMTLAPTRSENISSEKEAVGPDTGLFSTYEQRGWRHPRSRDVKKIEFRTLHRSLPLIAIGLVELDIENDRDVRFKACIDSLSTQGCSIRLNAWADTVFLSAAVTYLEFPAMQGDHIQTGTFDSADVYPWDRPQMKTTQWISFVNPYSEIPEILIWISGLNFDKTHNCRIRASASNITTHGFQINIMTWDDSILRSATVCWIAYPRHSTDVFGGAVETEVQPWILAQSKANGRVHFPAGMFTTAPRVAVALTAFDTEHRHCLRLRVLASNVTRDSFVWHIQTWSQSVFYYVKVSYIALHHETPTPELPEGWAG